MKPAPCSRVARGSRLIFLDNSVSIRYIIKGRETDLGARRTQRGLEWCKKSSTGMGHTGEEIDASA